MVITHQHQLGQVFGDPAANIVQRMHRYDRSCLCVWKIARNLKLANRLKLLWPVSNCKHLGLRSCCTVFGPSPAVRSFYLNIFHLHGQGGSGRLWIRNGYNVVVYDRSMKMDGPCALDRCKTDGTENVEFFFLDFFWMYNFWYLKCLFKSVNKHYRNQEKKDFLPHPDPKTVPQGPKKLRNYTKMEEPL